MAMIGNTNEPMSWRTYFSIQSSHSIRNTKTTDERVSIDSTGVLIIDVTDMTSFERP